MISKSTIEFLSDLMRNNYREWFAENRHRYDAAKDEALELSARVIDRINSFDPSLGYADPRKTLFRINRDTRFSKNKDPYKNHIGMAFSSQGVANSSDSSYYLHIEPEAAMLAVGLYMPTPEQLLSVRTAIETHWEEFSTILNDRKFKAAFGDLCRTDRVLKRAPKGFSEDSPAIEYLRLTAFYVLHPVSEDIILGGSFVDYVAEVFQAAKPLHLFINKAISNE